MQFSELTVRDWFSTEESNFIKVNENFAYDIIGNTYPEAGELVYFEETEEVEAIQNVDISYDISNEEEEPDNTFPWLLNNNENDEDEDSKEEDPPSVVVKKFLDIL